MFLGPRRSYVERLVLAENEDVQRGVIGEMEVLQRTLQKHLMVFGADKPAAEKLLAYGDSPKATDLDPGEHAAWTMVANLLINLDETISK